MLSPYQKPYTKALGKDGVLVTHEQTAMQKHASQKADLFHDKVDYSVSDANRGNFIAQLQLRAKGNNVLQRHLSLASKNGTISGQGTPVKLFKMK